MYSKEKIYNDALGFGMLEHDFGKYKAIFYKGFKFEKELLEDGFLFRIYNTRSSLYKEMNDSDVDILTKRGIFESSSFFSYFAYEKLMDRYKNTSENKASSYKTVEKSIKVMNEYRDRCLGILIKYPKLLED
jgi:hypothetical protein